MNDIPYVLTDDEIEQLAPCSPEHPPQVGDYVVRTEGQHYYDVSTSARTHLCRGHVCQITLVQASIDECDIKVLDTSCKSHGPGWILSYFSHYRKAQLRDEAL